MPESTSRVIYFTLQIFGLVTLPVLACTFTFCSSIKRHPTLANNALVWTLSSFIGCLLLFTNRLNGAEPSPALCKAQSALMLAQPSGVSAAALAIIWKVWSLSWRIRKNSAASDESLWLTCILLGSPYSIWTVLAIVFAIVQDGTQVHRSTFYCISDNQSLGIVSGAIAAIFLIFCLLFQIWTVVLVFQRFRKSRQLGRAEVGDIPIPFFIRIMSFMLVVFISLILCFVATWAFALEVPDLVVSSIGVLMFLIFATQGDVLIAWHLVRPKPRSTVSGTSGRDIYPTPVHIRPGLSPTSSRATSVFDLPTGQKDIHRLDKKDDSIELSSMKPGLGVC